MHVSRETEAESDARLRRVMALADFVVYDGTFAFVESPAAARPADVRPDALALVRDDDVWSQLVPAAATGTERAAEAYALFRFHFPTGVDNSGFVGWLANRLKRELGTGVFVICGHNSRRGGIFDYWGCPVEVRDGVRRVIEQLRAEAK